MNNLSRFAQPVELDLREWQGAEPVELLGGAQFPRIGELPYLLTVAGHGFYWLRIPRIPHPDAEPAAHPRQEFEAAPEAQPYTPEQPVDVLTPEDDA